MNAEWSVVKQALLERRLKGGWQDPAPPQILPRQVRESAPLSFSQRQIWVIDQLTPGNPAYNLPTAYRLRGDLNVAALEASFNEVINRHEVLRTTFVEVAGEPVQQIHPPYTLTVDVRNLDRWLGPDRERRVQELVTQEAVTPFDLSRLPLIRICLFPLAARDHVLLVNLHHIVADGVSIGLMFDELDALYRANTDCMKPQLPTLAVQYGDFALWQRQGLGDAAVRSKQIDFWQSQLSDKLPVIELPQDKARPALQSFNGSNIYFRIPKPLADALNTCGSRVNGTPFMTMLAAFQLLLHRYSKATDLVVGTPVATRTCSEIEQLIGNFLNMAAIRCDLSGNPSFLDVMKRSRSAAFDAFSNIDVPFASLTEYLPFARDPSRNPIFQVMLQLLPKRSVMLGALELESFHFDLGFAQFDLSLHLYEDADGYLGRFEYCTDLFERETVQRLSSNFVQLLDAVVRDPHQRISNISFLAVSESEQLLNHWNHTETPLPASLLIHEQFERQAESTPGRTAVIDAETVLSYQQLNEHSNRIAQALRVRGVGRGQRVGVCVERGSGLLATLLATLKAGASYVTLDPSWPEDRLRSIAEDARLSVLVSTTDVAASFGLRRMNLLLVDEDAAEIASMPPTPVPVDARSAQPDDPAYVIYTSGSTGNPKGVVVPHRAVVNFLASMAREPGLTAADVLVAVTTCAFDISVLELQLPLTVGACVVIATREEMMEGRLLKALLQRHAATVMQATPVTWQLLLDAGWTGSAPFKALIGGESLPQRLAGELLAQGVDVWNMYGPTETTVWSTCAHVTDNARPITIGKPIANTTIRVLDSHLQLCPVNVPGELCIGGAGVALGYWNRPELTADRFIPDPFSARATARLYRTGDRARWRNDGTLEHLGRLDFQIKLRGFRIEPGEIEAVIARHPAVRAVAVVARSETADGKRLVAFLVADHPPHDLVDTVRASLRRSVPDYMIPAHYVLVPAIPLTANGKTDRMSLMSLPLETTPKRQDASRSLTPTEETVLSIFCAVFGRPHVGISDNFFDLGGHSLMAARAMVRLRAACGRDIPLRLLFERQTAAELAEAIDALEWFANSSVRPAGGAANRVEIAL